MTLLITDTQHTNALHDAECHYAECSVLFMVMLSVPMLNIVVLSVVMLSVVVPLERLAIDKHARLLRTFVNYGRKKFDNIGPWV